MSLKIFPPSPDGTVQITLSNNTVVYGTKAELLGTQGESLKSFPLYAKQNQLSLAGMPPGQYTLRVEQGQEVVARQIFVD